MFFFFFSSARGDGETGAGLPAVTSPRAAGVGVGGRVLFIYLNYFNFLIFSRPFSPSLPEN